MLPRLGVREGDESVSKGGGGRGEGDWKNLSTRGEAGEKKQTKQPAVAK